MKTGFILLAAASSAAAHATWQQLWVGSTDMADQCVRRVVDNNPIAGITSADMACGRSPASSSGVCEVQAGGTLSVEMHQQPGQRACGTEAIGGRHFGPVIVYMAKVSDAKSASSSGVKWFKVAEDGYTGTESSWGTEILNRNCGKKTFTVPKSIASGDYLVRSEVLALHSGAGNTQPYVSCFQVKVSGGGSASPSGVSFPGAYSSSDPLFSKSIWDSSFKYVSPGPAVYSG